MHPLDSLLADKMLFADATLPTYIDETMTVEVRHFEADDKLHDCRSLRFTFATDTGLSPVVHIVLLDLWEGSANMSTEISVFNDTNCPLSEQLRLLGECAAVVKGVLKGRVSVDM